MVCLANVLVHTKRLRILCRISIKEKDKKKELDHSHYFGLAKCTVLPPHGLFHPVLPYRHAGKLTFPLCASCVTEEMSKPFLERTPVCTHTDSERQLVGTWCTPEPLKAIEKGYTVVCVKCGIS